MSTEEGQIRPEAQEALRSTGSVTSSGFPDEIPAGVDAQSELEAPVEEDYSYQESPIYKQLGAEDATPEEKVSAGHRLIHAQKKDLDRMKNRLVDLQKGLTEKEKVVSSLYDMIEKVYPLLTQMNGWNEKLTAEQDELLDQIRQYKKELGLPEDEDELETENMADMMDATPNLPPINIAPPHEGSPSE